jgi:hypothetical protein
MPEPSPSPSSRPAGPVVVLDLIPLHDRDLTRPDEARAVWAELHAASALQGLVNRDGPQLFVRFLPEVDDFWWDWFHAPGGWLAGREVVRVERLDDAIERFRDRLTGIVTYRERPYAASNVASTLAGAERRLPVLLGGEAGGLLERLRACVPALLEDRVDLVAEDGTPIWESAEQRKLYRPTTSIKNNAYRWLTATRLASGDLASDCLGYYIDSYWLTRPQIQPLQNCTLTNHDYFIGRGAMILDLNAWHDESAVDEPDQPAGLDLETLRSILRAYHDRNDGRMLHVAGFTPWAWKYSSEPGAGSAHHGVQSEWELIRILSAYNAYLDADAISLAGMSNASFYQHFPLADRYPQSADSGLDALRAEGLLTDTSAPADRAYVQFYMGDYDAAAWLNQELPRLFKDPARGTMDLAWAFNPNLCQRAPHAMHYARTTATARDHFVTGDSGAGYVSPAMFETPRLDPDLPDGYQAWIDHCIPYYERFNLDITGFIIEGRAPAIGDRGLEAYARFSPGGILCHRHIPHHGLHETGMPYARMTADIDGEPADVARSIMEHVSPRGVQFLTFRSVLKAPTWIAEVMEHLVRLDKAQRIRFVGPTAFMELIRQQHVDRGTSSPEVEIRTEATRDMLHPSRPTRA